MASLNASKRDRLSRVLRDRWERKQGRRRIIAPDSEQPFQTVQTVTTELTAPIDEPPEDDPRRMTFESIKKAMDQVSGIVDLPMPKIIVDPNLPPDMIYMRSGKAFTRFTPTNPSLPDKDGWYGVDTAKEADPPIEIKVYRDGQEVAIVKRESLFGGTAIEFAEDSAISPIEPWRKNFRFGDWVSQPTFQFRFTEYPVTEPMMEAPASVEADRQKAVLDAINEITRSAMQEVWLGSFCKANCGERTRNQSGYCTTCLDRMALVGRAPKPTMKTPLVELRPKRQIQLED